MLILPLPVGEVIEVDVGAAPVLALETLAHDFLTRADIIEERR